MFNIKENKIFIILLCTMIIVITYLGTLFLIPDEDRFASNTNLNNDSNIDTYISTFNVTLNENLNINYNWNINIGDQNITKSQILHDDKVVADVTDKATYNEKLLSSNYLSGNNKFILRLTLEDDSILEKNCYLYINEAFGFKVNAKVNDNILTYSVDYYYFNDKPVNVPKVNYRFNSAVYSHLNYVKNTVESSDKYTKVNAVYEMNLSSWPIGSYKADITWVFDEYNLSYPTSNSFDVEGE